MKLIVLTLASLFAFSSFSQLTGTYTVGGTTPDFATVGEACTQIETQGISGPVTINIRDGVYADSIHLTDFSGASAVNTITFQSESMDAANVEITNGNDSPVYLSGETVDYITIQHLTLTAASNFSAVAISNGVNNFTLNDCVVNGFSSTGTSPTLAAVSILSGVFNNDSITISKNTINNGSYGIHFNNSGLFGTVTITNNILNENYYHSIYLYEFGDIQLTDNIINSSGASFAGAHGILMTNGVGEMTVERNEIYRTNQAGGSGFNFSSIGGTAVFKNNIVSMPGNNCSAVSVDYIAAEVAFYNNTFRVGNRVFTGYYDVEFAIYNNILISTNGGYIYDISYNNVTFPPASNNNVYSTAGNFADLSWPINTTYGSLGDYQTGTGLDVNSFEITDFMFVDDVFDLHTCNDSLIGAGISLPSVMVDIDGEPRSMNAYSIGADYFNIDGSLWNGGNVETCTGVPITLDAGAADSYLWSTLETTQTISAANFAQYTVEWTNVCGTYFDTVVINDITPVASFTNVQSFLTFQFTNTSQNGTSYLWDFGDGTTSTETNPTHVYSDLNTYTVTLTVTSACGTDVETLQVTPSTVGLDELDVANIVVYPNPSSGVFHIKSDNVIDNITVQDGMGRLVYQSNGNTIDLSTLQNGIYYLVLNVDNRRILKRIQLLK